MKLSSAFFKNTQTNWKYILIVVVLSFIVGLSLFIYQKNQLVPLPVPISFYRPPNYQKMIGQMFPEKEFSKVLNRNYCVESKHKFEESEQLMEGIRDYYCIKEMIDGSFTNPNKKETLLIVRYGYEFDPEKDDLPRTAHASGLDNVYLSAFDKSNWKVLSETINFTMDSSEFGLYQCGEKDLVFFIGESMYQGWFTDIAQLLEIRNGKFIKIWPKEKDWPGELKRIKISEGRLTICEYAFSDEGLRVDTEPVKEYNLIWNKDKCQFEQE